MRTKQVVLVICYLRNISAVSMQSVRGSGPGYAHAAAIHDHLRGIQATGEKVSY